MIPTAMWMAWRIPEMVGVTCVFSKELFRDGMGPV